MKLPLLESIWNISPAPLGGNYLFRWRRPVSEIRTTLRSSWQGEMLEGRGMEPYPAPGPAGRTTALPLRLRIPPLPLHSAWGKKKKRWTTSRSVRTMELRQAGSSSGDKELLQGGAAERLRPVREGLYCGWVSSFVCTLPTSHTSHPPTSRQGPIPVLRPAAASAAAAETWQ